MSSNYTVRLREVFQGPLDLLLHLVREQEVEIHEVQISKVIEGYLAYLKDLKDLDIELAGEFLVMAATLMAIKSRSLLPRDAVDLEEDLDPRDELIQRLIEYRRFKEAGDNLYERFEERVQIYPRGPQDELAGKKPEPTVDLGELTSWDLLATFSRLMRETLANRPHHIKTDPRPLRFYVERMANLVRDAGHVSLRAIAEADEAPSRESMIGSFCALLEMCRLGLIEVTQDDIDSDIMIQLRPEHQADLDEVVSGSSFDDEIVAEADEAGEAGEVGETGEDAAESDSEEGDAPADTPQGAGEDAASELLVQSHETPETPGAPRASEQGES